MSGTDLEESSKSDRSGKKEKKVTIIVEGAPHEWPKKQEICHIDVVRLEEPSPDPQTTYSVKYKKGRGNRPEGILAPGSCIKVKEGMVFSVSETGQS